MGWDSFDGGSHGSHQWVAVGHERVEDWDHPGSGPAPDGKHYILPDRKPDRFFIVRACQLCSEVWWQEYDVAKAMTA